MLLVLAACASGFSRKMRWRFFMWLLGSCRLVLSTETESSGVSVDSFFVSTAMAPLATPILPMMFFDSKLPLKHGSDERHLLPHIAQNLASSPFQAPYYGPLITTGHPLTSSQSWRSSMKRSKLTLPAEGLMSPQLAEAAPAQSRLPEPPLSPEMSNCCGPDMVLKRESHGCHCVYPIKLDILLLNVSENPSWNIFLEEFALGLGLRVSQIQLNNFYWVTLSSLNISMDITPHTRITFSGGGVSAINSSLSSHKVHIDLKLAGVGDYKLLNVTWYQPPAPSPAPLVAAAPAKVPHHQASATSTTTPIASHKERNSSLVVVLIVGGGVLILLYAW